MASSIPGGYIVASNEPIDSRVQTQSTSSRDSRLVANMHEGLITFVKENGLLYVLTNTGSGNLTSTIGNSPGSIWKQITTTDMVGNTFATMSIFNGTGTTFILSDSPSASLFISTSNQNLTITPNAVTDTITFGFSSTPTFTAVTASNILITNNLVVGGRVTAQEFHTEFVSASIIYQSGSTQFGNSSDDTHQFTGSLLVKGNSVFDGSLYFSASSAGNVSNSVLVRDNSTGQIKLTGSYGGGGSAVTTLDDLTNVTITSPTNGQALVYNAGVWENGTPISSSYSITASFALNVDGGFY